MHGFLRGIAAMVAALSVGVGAYQGEWLDSVKPGQSAEVDMFQDLETQVVEQATSVPAVDYNGASLFSETLTELSRQIESGQGEASEAVRRLEGVMQDYGIEIQSMQECNDQNYQTLKSRIDDVTAHVTVLTKQQESLDRLLEEVASVKSQVSVVGSTLMKSGSGACECKCATAEEIADAVAKKLEPMLLTVKQSNGWLRTEPTAGDGTFTLNPGEVLTHINGVPVSQSSNVVVQGQPVQQYVGPGVVARTANAGRRIFGQVRSNATCQSVYNSATGRFETRCP